MNKYKVKYTICTEYEAKSDEEACKIDEAYLNHVFKDGLEITKLKIKRRIIDNVDTDSE